jgi:integrase
VEGLAGISSRSREELGVSDTTIQCILRHENVNTTQRFYIEIASAVAVDAMKKVEKKISGTAVVQ